MRPLTLTKPKPLLDLQGQPILAWSLQSLRGIVDRVLIVVSHFQEQIASFMQSQTLLPDYTLVEQLPEPLGTGHALACCRPHLRNNDFLVVNGDDLYSHAALRELSRHSFAILSMKRGDFPHYGVIVSDKNKRVLRIDEKPPRHRYQSPAPCSVGAYKLTADVFDYDLRPSARGEYEIVDAVGMAARDHPIVIVDTPFWLPIGNPEALSSAQDIDIQRWIPSSID